MNGRIEKDTEGVTPAFSSFFSSVSSLQARNIAVCIEFKDSDEDEAQPLKVHLCYVYKNLNTVTDTRFPSKCIEVF